MNEHLIIILINVLLFGLVMVSILGAMTKGKVAYIFVSLMAISTFSVSAYTGYNIIKADYDQWQEAMICVSDKINSGVERKDIVISNNTCYVR